MFVCLSVFLFVYHLSFYPYHFLFFCYSTTPPTTTTTPPLPLPGFTQVKPVQQGWIDWLLGREPMSPDGGQVVDVNAEENGQGGAAAAAAAAEEADEPVGGGRHGRQVGDVGSV